MEIWPAFDGGRRARVLPALACLAVLALPAAARAIELEIVNESGVADADVRVMLHADSLASTPAIQRDKAYALTDPALDGLVIDQIKAGRIFVSFRNAVTFNEDNNSKTRYDKVELTVGRDGENKVTGAANLTAVDFYGIPFRIETLDASGRVLEKLTQYASTNTMVSRLQAVARQDNAKCALVQATPQAAALRGSAVRGNALRTAAAPTPPAPSPAFVRLKSPVIAPTCYENLNAYVTAMDGTALQLNGNFDGVPFLSPPSVYRYAATWNKDQTVTLARSSASQPAPEPSLPVTFAVNSISEAIYTCNGAYKVNGRDATVSDNDVYSAIYRDFISAFDFGFAGGRWGTDSSLWYTTLPYHPPYACARTTDDGRYNKYASVIAENSDSYGFPFSDRIQKVLASVREGTKTLRITILPDDLLDAPRLTSVAADDTSLTLDWDAVAGADGYTITYSPPLGAESVDAGNVKTYTLTGLRAGTPYTVSVAATDSAGKRASEAMAFQVATAGATTSVGGAVHWSFVPDIDPPGSSEWEIEFNGQRKRFDAPNYNATNFQPTGQPGVQNSYVLKLWKPVGAGKYELAWQTMVYVTLAATPATGDGAVTHDPAVTFVANNVKVPTYDQYATNLYVHLEPRAPRGFCDK